jgi:hypothetical protein
MPEPELFGNLQRRALSETGVSNTMSVVRTARGYQTPNSIPVGGQIDLMGAARLQTPRPAAAGVRGNTGQRHKVANKQNQNTKEPAELIMKCLTFRVMPAALNFTRGDAPIRAWVASAVRTADK